MSNGKRLHFVELAVVCWAIWKLPNRKCFEAKLSRSPSVIICYTCVFLNFWTGLMKGANKTNMEAGAGVLSSNGAHACQDERNGPNNQRVLTV
jgi:hypothetical protein